MTGGVGSSKREAARVFATLPALACITPWSSSLMIMSRTVSTSADAEIRKPTEVSSVATPSAFQLLLQMARQQELGNAGQQPRDDRRQAAVMDEEPGLRAARSRNPPGPW